jgi:hypothetical protein
MSGEFTTWTDLRVAIKDAIANHVAGNPCRGSYSISGRSITYRSFDELINLYEKTFQLEKLDDPVTIKDRIAYGRHRRFD